MVGEIIGWSRDCIEENSALWTVAWITLHFDLTSLAEMPLT